MVVTPFGDLEIGNGVALQSWLDAHARRHSVLSRATGLPARILHGPVDGDWFYRHWAAHVSLGTFQSIDLNTVTQGLALNGIWKNQQQLIDWHELHNRIHLKQDRQLGIS